MEGPAVPELRVNFHCQTPEAPSQSSMALSTRCYCPVATGIVRLSLLGRTGPATGPCSTTLEAGHELAAAQAPIWLGQPCEGRASKTVLRWHERASVATAPSIRLDVIGHCGAG